MISWRDSASPQAQDDLDGLLDVSLRFAQQQLGKFGEFYPIAMVVAADGDQRMIATDTGGGRPESANLLDALFETVIAQRQQLRCVAIVADVHVPEVGSDAIRVSLEHAEEIAIAVLLPYRPQRFGRGIDYGELRAGDAHGFMWSDNSGQSV